MKNFTPIARWIFSSVAFISLAACAGKNPELGATPTQKQFINFADQEYAKQQFAVDDPAEGLNKYTYKFNAELDRYVLVPVVDAYTYVTPEFLRHRVSDFFLNIGEFGNFTNSAFQLSPEKTFTTLGRFAINTTVGLLGTFDVATDWGLQRQKEDFGQTLGYWGAGPGPYIVLPFFGPSNLRDTTGTIVDFATFSWAVPNHIENSVPYEVVEYGVQPMDMRYENSFRYFESGTPFEYEIVRYVWSRSRELEIEK